MYFLHSLILRVSLESSIYKCWIARDGNESREREENVWNIIKCNFWAEPTRESDWMLIMTIKITMVTQHTYSACRYNFINFTSPLNADVTKFFPLFLCFSRVVLNVFAEAIFISENWIGNKEWEILSCWFLSDYFAVSDPLNFVSSYNCDSQESFVYWNTKKYFKWKSAAIIATFARKTRIIYVQTRIFVPRRLVQFS